MSPLRRVVDIVGRVLIGVGVVLLLFTAYQIWGTSVQESRTQAGLRTQLGQESNSQLIRHALAEEAALNRLPTGPPRTLPRTNAPPEGDPIGYIRIPKIGINQVVVEGTDTPDLRKGPGHYTGTPLPGQGGNVAVAGHRTTYGHPFYNLDSVKIGDPIVLTTLQGIFVYDADQVLRRVAHRHRRDPERLRQHPDAHHLQPALQCLDAASSSRASWSTPSSSPTRACPRRGCMRIRRAGTWPGTPTSS